MYGAVGPSSSVGYHMVTMSSRSSSGTHWSSRPSSTRWSAVVPVARGPEGSTMARSGRGAGSGSPVSAWAPVSARAPAAAAAARAVVPSSARLRWCIKMVLPVGSEGRVVGPIRSGIGPHRQPMDAADVELGQAGGRVEDVGDGRVDARRSGEVERGEHRVGPDVGGEPGGGGVGAAAGGHAHAVALGDPVAQGGVRVDLEELLAAE